MRILFTILFTFILGSSYAQEPVYNQMRSNYQFKGVRVDSLLLFPKFNDTTAANNTALDSIVGNVIRVGNTIYYRSADLKKWLTFGGGSSVDTTSLSNRINSKADTSELNGVIYFTDTLTTIATKSDILSPIDTTSLSNRINSKADSTIDLQKVTDNGNQTTNDIQFTNDNNLLLDTFSSMLFPNYSRIKEGTIDAQFGGNKGVALICGLGYEYKWEGGMLFVMNGNGNAIREAKYMFTYVPQDTNDVSEGYYVGSRWILDNGDTYICTDNTINAAVWDLQPNAFDSTSLSNRINDKIDSLKKENDTVYFKKNGVWFTSFKDSVGGGGQNGRWGNDTAVIILAKVHNDAGSILQRGEVVMLKGSNGDVASVIRANNKYDSTSALTIGIVKDNIAVNDTGWIVTQGQINKMKTQAFNEGDALYLDSIPGKLTNVKPIAPFHGVFVGIVERANNGNGLIYTKPQNGYELTEIHDVRIVNPINNQVLVYSDTQDIWKNRNVYSVVDTTKLSARIDAKLNSVDTASLSSRINESQEDFISVLNLLGGSYKSKVAGGDFLNAILTLSIADGNQYFMPIYLQKADTIKGVSFYQRAQGAYAADNYNGFALYSYSGGTLTLIDSTANDGNIWKGTANSWQSKDFVNKTLCQKGLYYISLVYNTSLQSTQPTMQSFGSVAGTNYTLMPNGNGYKIYGNATGRSTPVSSQALSALTALLNNPFLLIY